MLVNCLLRNKLSLFNDLFDLVEVLANCLSVALPPTNKPFSKIYLIFKSSFEFFLRNKLQPF